MWGLKSSRRNIEEDSPIVHSGYLEKKGAKVHNWKNRWFELHSNGNLYYFKKKPKDNRQSVIDEALGVVHLDPKKTCIHVVHQYNQIQQLGLTYKTYETVFEPEKIRSQNPLKLDMNKVYTVYKRRYRRSLSNRRQSVLNASANNEAASPASKRTKRKSISWEMEGKLRSLIGQGKELNNFKFMITTQSDDGKKVEKKFNAPTQYERNKWISVIEESLVKIELENAKQRNKDTLSHDKSLFSDVAQYMEFVNLSCSKPSSALFVMNGVTRSIEEDVVIALMIMTDKFLSARNTSSQELCSAAIIDELNNSIDQGTLFRRNSVSTKLVTMYFRIHGLAFLQSLLTEPLLKIIVEDVDYEIALDKIIATLQSKSTPDANVEAEAKKIQAHNYEVLKQLSKQFLTEIMQASLEQCPAELRQVMRVMYEESNTKWNCGEMCVGALFFLRFLCPAIISPHLFGISQAAPRANAQRTLLLLTKLIQSIANGVTDTSKKEPFMIQLHDFIQDLQNPTKEFLKQMATVTESPRESLTLSTYIDEVLLLQCLQILHKSLQKTWQSKQFTSTQEEITDFYHSMIYALKIAPRPELKRSSSKNLFTGLQNIVQGRSRARNVKVNSARPQIDGIENELTSPRDPVSPLPPNADEANETVVTPRLSIVEEKGKVLQWDLSQERTAVKRIMTTISDSVSNILVDINSQIMDQSLTLFNFASGETMDDPFECKITSFADRYVNRIIQLELSSALFAFLRLTSNPWKLIRLAAKENLQLQQLVTTADEFIQNEGLSDKQMVEEIKFCALVCEAMNRRVLLNTISPIFNALKLSDSLSGKRQKILHHLTQIDLLPVELKLQVNPTFFD